MDIVPFAVDLTLRTCFELLVTVLAAIRPHLKNVSIIYFKVKLTTQLYTYICVYSYMFLENGKFYETKENKTKKFLVT